MALYDVIPRNVTLFPVLYYFIAFNKFGICRLQQKSDLLA